MTRSDTDTVNVGSNCVIKKTMNKSLVLVLLVNILLLLTLRPLLPTCIFKRITYQRVKPVKLDQMLSLNCTTPGLSLDSGNS